MAAKTSELASSSLDSVQTALGDLRGAHEEFEGFFGDMFDQLQSLSLELLARHKCLELNSHLHAERESADAEQSRRFEQCLDAIRELNANVRSAQEETNRLWSELSQGQQRAVQENAEMQKMREDMQRMAGALGAMREGVEKERLEADQRLVSIQEQLERLASASAQSAAALPLVAQDERLAEVLETARQQQASWQKDRAELEAKLESERQRSTQQDEALAQHRQLAAQQQAELAGELKRMRSLLEVLLKHIPQPAAAAAGDGVEAVSSGNAALESMLAQFEMLTRDLAERRAGWHKTPVKP